MRRFSALAAAAAAVILLVGCATTGPDWNSLIGHYSYDEAVAELGVPDRTATLSDGSIVAEWLQSRGGSYGTLHYFPGSRFQTYDVNEFPDRYLRLVFSPERQLIRAQKFSK